ncbi:uncharacterized protein LOC112538589 [Tetranychus urticae]|uniref:Uncharacterized protein n=1 Tax=Tetranychus urticae TaxID=32264 RepID=T1K3Q3_TETUR|nr:uncharacterized protein LOC112538589 [Tetranychus urticae]
MEPFKIEGNQSKSLEQDEKIKNDKLRKLIYKCTVTLSISSPLSCKLRERLASILPKVSSNPFPWHEKYCKTNIRLHYGDYTPYSSHLHPQYKPPRPLRSNTSIVEEKTSVPSSWSSSSKASDVHHYSFNRKQRYRRWTQIEDKYSSVFDETDSYNNIITLESDNSNDSEVKSNPRLSSWSTTPVIFPIIDFDEIVEAQLEKEARSRLQYQVEYSDHNSHVNPPYIIFFVPDDSNKSVPNETVADLPPSLGYEIILEPMNISSTSLPPQTSSPSSSSSSPPISTSPSPDRTIISCDQVKPELVKNDNNLIQTDVKLIHKSISEIPKKDFAPLRRSMRREKISSKSNCVINETNQSSIRVEPKRTQATNKNSSSVCDITLSNISYGNTKPSFSKEMLKTEDVVIKHLSASAETVIKAKPSIKPNKRIQEKLIPLETTTLNSLRKVNHTSSQSIRHSKRALDDEVMVIRTKDDIPRKKVDTDDVVMIKVMQSSRRPRLRK